jgi:ABC-type multidrug transport system fused ATPase/permease subunit
MKLVMENIDFSYNPGTPVLKNFNLMINSGETVAIIGHNGSGKSTIAKLIVGLLKADSGNIYIDDELLSENSDILSKIKRRDLSYFSAGNQLEELCSETDYVQTCDKIYRALRKGNTCDAALNLWFGVHYNFFMFSPFFYFTYISKAFI